MKNKKKGFTLVELIVVLAILAILAAMLVPALTGYIDKANEKKAVAAARQYAIAAQSVASEAYASNKKVTSIVVTTVDTVTVTVNFDGATSESTTKASASTANNYAAEFYKLSELKDGDTATFNFSTADQKMLNTSVVTASKVNLKYDGTSWSKS